MACVFVPPNVHPNNCCVVVWPRMKNDSPLVKMGGQESRWAYLIGTLSLVKECSPNVIFGLLLDPPNVLMGGYKSRWAGLMGTLSPPNVKFTQCSWHILPNVFLYKSPNVKYRLLGNIHNVLNPPNILHPVY
jgi:hypothetical protein